MSEMTEREYQQWIGGEEQRDPGTPTRPPHAVDFSMTAVQGETVTAVSVFFHLGDEVVEVVGEAKVHPKDENDPDVGYKLAYGRALCEVGERLVREAYRKIDKNAVQEWMKRNAPGLLFDSGYPCQLPPSPPQPPYYLAHRDESRLA